MRLSTFAFTPLILVMSYPVLFAQDAVQDLNEIPVFRATAVSGTVKSVNFHYRQGSTELALHGTALAPRAKGLVRADSKTGATKLDIRADNLPAPWSVNESALTYVVWAVTPDGRPEAVGELAVGTGDDAHLVASSELQAFGLIVTAEPYFAVTQPSDIVVMEATVTPQTAGTIQTVDAKYELLPRDAYMSLLPPARQAQLKVRDKSPVDLLQARHAVAIAESFGAARYAEDTLSRAKIDLKNAEDFNAHNGDRKKVETLARGVVQLSEDARLISVRKRQADAIEQERAAATQHLQQAKTDAEREARRRELAEADARGAQARESEATQIAAEERHRRELAVREAARSAEVAAQAQVEAESARRTATSAKQEADASIARNQLESDAAVRTAQEARTQTEQALKAAEAQRTAAVTALQQAEQAKSEANQLLADARTKQTALTEAAEQSKQRADQAEQERLHLREELRRQLNVVFITKENARGLVLSMSGVLFDTGRNQLNPGAREKLAKVAGILQTHPDLKIEVEGHTDSVGSVDLNQKLSSARAQAVRDYLVQQGVVATSITYAGKGSSTPVASNATAAGRQQNRRVELVVSGAEVDSKTPGF